MNRFQNGMPGGGFQRLLIMLAIPVLLVIGASALVVLGATQTNAGAPTGK